MNMKKITALLLMMAPIFSSAEDMSTPHTFAAGTTIKSAEMNENFATIESSINQQAQQFAAVETGIDDLKQSTDSNGVTLGEITSVLSTISESLVSIDTKLTTTSPASVSDQLVCFGARNWVADNSSITCIQASDPDNSRSLTFISVLKEGWIAISVGGDTYVDFIFHK